MFLPIRFWFIILAFDSVVNPEMKEWLESTISIKKEREVEGRLRNRIQNFLNEQRKDQYE